MSNSAIRKFVLIECKSFDVVCEGKSLDGLQINENGRGNRISIALNESEVKWLVEALNDFYWLKGGATWAKKLIGDTRKLFIVLCWNRRGRILVLSEENGRSVKRIFIPEGYEAGGW